MAVTIYVSGFLAALVSGEDTIVLDDVPQTLADALSDLWETHLVLRDRVIDETGAVRPHVNVFVDGESVKRSQGLLTELGPNSEIFILPAVSGGAIGYKIVANGHA